MGTARSTFTTPRTPSGAGAGTPTPWPPTQTPTPRCSSGGRAAKRSAPRSEGPPHRRVPRRAWPRNASLLKLSIAQSGLPTARVGGEFRGGQPPNPPSLPQAPPRPGSDPGPFSILHVVAGFSVRKHHVVLHARVPCSRACDVRACPHFHFPPFACQSRPALDRAAAHRCHSHREDTFFVARTLPCGMLQ